MAGGGHQPSDGGWLRTTPRPTQARFPSPPIAVIPGGEGGAATMDDEERYLANVIAAGLVRNNGYHARAEIDRLLAAIAADPKRLEPFGFKAYSQGDEDGIIEEIFRRLGIDKGVFCEIGVENGLECNSLYLLHKGWTGAWIEGNKEQLGPIRDKFGSILGKRLKVSFRLVSADNVNAVIAEAIPDKDAIDFLSIDIDGNDVYLLAKLDFSPKVICIEYNARFRGNLAKAQVHDPSRLWAGTDYFGASLKSIAEAGAAKGYRLVGTSITGSNAFLVRADLAGDLFAENCSPEQLYNPPRYWLIFDHYQNIGHRPDFGPYTDLA